MPCDAFSYHFIAAELAQMLVGGRIDKVNMPEHDEVVLTVRSNRANLLLVLSAGTYPRVHITSTQRENPLAASSFCMCLRKNIGGGVISSVSTQPFERAVFIDIVHRNELGVKENRRLVCEIMGKYSNIILTGGGDIDSADGAFRIIESVRHIPLDVSAKRQILPTMRYFAPVQDKLSPLDKAGISKLDLSGDAFEVVQRSVKGLAPVTINEAIFRAQNIDGGAVPNGELLAGAFEDMYSLPTRPCCLIDNAAEGIKGDFFVRPYLSIPADYLFFDSLSEAMDYHYSTRDQRQRLSTKAKSLSTILKNAIKRANKRLSEFSLQLSNSQNSDVDRMLGDLITANIYQIKAGQTLLLADNYFEGGKTEIALDPTLSPAQNAQKYYKKYAKKKRTCVAAAQLVSKTEEDLAAFNGVLFALENISSTTELVDISDEMAQLGLIKAVKKSKQQRTSLPIRTVFEGFSIEIGRNNMQNDRLLRSAAKTDIWLHVRLFHGSHVVIRAENQTVPDRVLLFAAECAAYYSAARGSDKVEVDFCLARHVSKPSGAAAGRVVYTNQKTLLVTPKPIT